VQTGQTLPDEPFQRLTAALLVRCFEVPEVHGIIPHGPAKQQGGCWNVASSQLIHCYCAAGIHLKSRRERVFPNVFHFLFIDTASPYMPAAGGEPQREQILRRRPESLVRLRPSHHRE
jgi:hypothetical protein